MRGRNELLQIRDFLRAESGNKNSDAIPEVLTSSEEGRLIETLRLRAASSALSLVLYHEIKVSGRSKPENPSVHWRLEDDGKPVAVIGANKYIIDEFTTRAGSVMDGIGLPYEESRFNSTVVFSGKEKSLIFSIDKSAQLQGSIKIRPVEHHPAR